MIVGIPVKSFGISKRRLDGHLDSEARAVLARRLATHTVTAVIEAGGFPVVVTNDGDVRRWAGESGVESIDDFGRGLDHAAYRIVERAGGDPWLVCHADLPLLAPLDLEPALTAAVAGRAVIAPSSDGGTTLLGAGRPDFRFTYGPGSFHRHLPRLDDPLILTSLGLCLDLDAAADLDAAIGHRRGIWLSRSTSG